MKVFYKILTILNTLIFCATPAVAAELYLAPSQSITGQGNVYLVDVKIDSQNEEINAVESTLYYPKTLVLKNIQTGQSLINFWVKPPEATTSLKKGFNAIGFSGLTPGGLTTGGGVVASFSFRSATSSREEKSFLLTLANSRVLLNDGRGTAANLTVKNVTLSAAVPAAEPNQAISGNQVSDSIPPENFTVAVSKNPNLFDNKWFVAFLASDKQSGIDHYEIQESLNPDANQANWRVATNPAVLLDQTRKSYILVKAVDRYGQSKIEVVSPIKNQPANYTKVLISCIILLVVIALVVRIFALKRRRQAHEQPNT